MISQICSLNATKESFEVALTEAEHFANLCVLSEKNTLHLRLLAEELLGMATGVLELSSGFFFIEAEAWKFQLRLAARANVGEEAKSRLLSASSTGENALYMGISGKIRQAIDLLLVGPPSGSGLLMEIPIGVYGRVYDGMIASPATTEWSLERYRQSVAREEKAKAWDELEKSILGKLADDVRIGLRLDQVEITIAKTF